VFCWTGWIRVLFVSLLVGGIRWSRLDEEGATDLGVFQTTAFAYGLFLWFWRETATGWYALEGMANGLTWVARHLGLNATLGPTAAGIPVTALLLTYGIAPTLARPRPGLRTLLALSASLLGVQIAFVAIHAAAGGALPQRRARAAVAGRRRLQERVSVPHPASVDRPAAARRTPGRAQIRGARRMIRFRPALPRPVGNCAELAER
jgi:hypothetical protein